MSTHELSPLDPAAGWVRATLELAVAAVLTEGDLHGYALAQRLSGLGFGTVKGGALYPVLGRMEAEGSVCSLWQAGEGGPGRKVYSITPSGRTWLAVERARWHIFAAAVDRLLDTPGERP